MNPDGTEKVKVSYLKYKNGEATVRSVKIEQNFGLLSLFYLKHVSFPVVTIAV